MSDLTLIRKIVSKGHESTLEHSLFTYRIEGMSRACLQELSRHRVGVSPSVESTRYTLKRILNGEIDIEDLMISSGNDKLDTLIYDHMHKLCKLIKEEKIPNDVAKYGICESYPVRETISFNMRALRHFYKLRASKQAHFEIRELAEHLFAALPTDYDVFFEDLK